MISRLSSLFEFFKQQENPGQIFLTTREKFFLSVMAVLLLFSFYIDQDVLYFLSDVRNSNLDGFMLFITDFGLLYFIILFLVYLAFNRKFQDITLVILTSASALEISYLLKMILQTPRPAANFSVATIPLTLASGFSMPSMHTAFCFAVWPYLHQILPKKKFLYPSYGLIVLIAFSRLYLGVHYLSDVLAGGLIGYLLAKTWLFIQKRHAIMEWFIFQVKDKLELRRQITHMSVGLTVVFLLRLQLLNAEMLFIILIIGGILSLIRQKRPVPFLERILKSLERPADLKSFPGRGSFFMVLGSLLAVLFFRRDIALAAISVMAVGDALTTIVGTYFGKIPNPLNPKKHLEGTAVAVIFSTLAGFFFVDFHVALFGSLLAMIMESVTTRYFPKIIDDNLVVPLVAGLAMTWITA